jgi:ABC-type glycerol-3-phosphate transport system permease component
VGQRRLIRLGPSGLEGFGTVEGALFALLGLLIAFTFSAAADRFNRRRELVVTEANAIGTAYLRLDLLPAPAQPLLRRTFGQYIDARLDRYQALHELRFAPEEKARVADLQGDIWRQAVAACKAGPPELMLAVLPPINEMVDITTTREVALYTHIPLVVLALLVGLALVASLVAGYGSARTERRSWTHTVAFALLLATTLYVIVDYEFPRFGLIRMLGTDRLLSDLRATMP